MKYIYCNLIIAMLSVGFFAYLGNESFDVIKFLILFIAFGMCDVLNYIGKQEKLKKD